jgi:tripartite-type tricarboxylate transporter receptor subunit TctC
MQAVTFFSVVAPPGTPVAVARRIHGHLASAMALPDVKEKFAAQGAEPGGQSPENTAAFILAESAKWKKVISTANVTLD